ncbi:MAG: ribulokinase [Sedimentisphaerales bacterium]|nr:ribulokinase [Sedimentisphaerales bacterium]
MAYSLGLDYGTNSVRCLIVNTADGTEVATAIYEYETGEQGIILDRSDHNLARQNPADYLKGIEVTVKQSLEQAQQNDPEFAADRVIGIGVDTTGSTPLPVDDRGRPLCFHQEFRDNPNAHAWLWKDHTGYAEAAEITELAQKIHPEYLAKCGGTYSSEWFFSKVLHCLRSDPAVFAAAHTWVEHSDWLPAVLTGTEAPAKLRRDRCAAGHKAMFNDAWGGYPEADFLGRLDPALGRLRATLGDQTWSIDTTAGRLTGEWAGKLGLTAGIPVAMGAFDAHLGAVGAGIRQGRLVKIIGTSTCDMVVAPGDNDLPDIPGICGIVAGSILPGFFGLEAGQSAVGDIFNWFVNTLQPGGPQAGSHEALTNGAARLAPGQSGLLGLDWNNGNRTILVDQRLTGLLLGQTLHTRPEEIYRALIEATAFGALTIINRFEEYGVKIDEVINCGGIAEKNPLLMQIYADVLGRRMKLSRSGQTCALGAAIAGAVAAGRAAGGHDSVGEAQDAMCGTKETSYQPVGEHQKVYQSLYALYMDLHDAFGRANQTAHLGQVMKKLLEIKSQANR